MPSLVSGRWWRCSQHEILGEFGEGHGPVRRNDQGVFDPHSADARQVHTGFDGHHVAGSESTTRGRGDPRVLDDVVPSARHVLEQYANEIMEADPAQLKVRRGPIRFGVSGSRATTERSGSDPLEPDAIVSWPAPARSHHG